MTGAIAHRGRWFCSQGCIEAYDRLGTAGDARDRPARVSWRDPWVWVPLSAAALTTAGGWHPAAAGVSARYGGYLETVAVPLIVGLALGGLIDHFVPKAYIVTLLSGPRTRVIARATILGLLASTCSHGCLALSLELFRKGASVPAVISFLLASPWASMALTFLLLSLFGLTGLTFVIGALAIAFVTGLIFQRLAARGLIEANPNAAEVEEDFSIRRDIVLRIRERRWTIGQLAADARGVAAGMIPLGRMTLGWVQLGLVLSAAAGALIPHEVFRQWLGPPPAGLAATLGAATVIEVCSEGTAPLAYELYRNTGALGNAFAFLMGGVVTDYTELGAVWKTVGRHTVLWMLAVTLPMVAGAGLVLNALR